MKIQSTKYNDIYFWIVKVIKSCKTHSHFIVIDKIIKNYKTYYTSGDKQWDNHIHQKLKQHVKFNQEHLLN